MLLEGNQCVDLNCCRHNPLLGSWIAFLQDVIVQTTDVTGTVNDANVAFQIYLISINSLDHQFFVRHWIHWQIFKLPTLKILLQPLSNLNISLSTNKRKNYSIWMLLSNKLSANQLYVLHTSTASHPMPVAVCGLHSFYCWWVVFLVRCSSPTTTDRFPFRIQVGRLVLLWSDHGWSPINHMCTKYSAVPITIKIKPLRWMDWKAK